MEYDSNDMRDPSGNDDWRLSERPDGEVACHGNPGRSHTVR